MRLDEYQIANALIDTRLVMTSRRSATIPESDVGKCMAPCPFIGTQTSIPREGRSRRSALSLSRESNQVD